MAGGLTKLVAKALSAQGKVKIKKKVKKKAKKTTGMKKANLSKEEESTLKALQRHGRKASKRVQKAATKRRKEIGL